MRGDAEPDAYASDALSARLGPPVRGVPPPYLDEIAARARRGSTYSDVYRLPFSRREATNGTACPCDQSTSLRFHARHHVI